jgi:hypothetical protein
MISRGNRSTRRKPAQVPLCPAQIQHDLTWARTRAAAVGSRRLTAWAMVRPLSVESTALFLLYEVLEKFKCLNIFLTLENGSLDKVGSSILVLQRRFHCPRFITITFLFFSLALQPPWALASAFSFMIILLTVGLLGRVISSSQGLYLNTGQHKHRINIYTHQTSMPCVRFEPTIPASERAKTVHALNRSATVTGL